MDVYEELRQKYEALTKRCQRCTNLSMCPTCGIMKQMLQLSEQMEMYERFMKKDK